MKPIYVMLMHAYRRMFLHAKKYLTLSQSSEFQLYGALQKQVSPSKMISFLGSGKVLKNIIQSHHAVKPDFRMDLSLCCLFAY